jgi:hypothetical protein
MLSRRERFSTTVDAKILSAFRAMARRQGRQIQLLVDEALADLVKKHGKRKPRQPVMTAYLASHERYRHLYEKLAE